MTERNIQSQEATRGLCNSRTSCFIYYHIWRPCYRGPIGILS